MTRSVMVPIAFVLLAFGSGQPRQQSQILGVWTEHWGTDTIHPETDVHYVDTITISSGRNGLAIMCHHDSMYRYDKIRVKDDSLFFTMENISTPNSPFFVHFHLKQVAHDRMEGRITNSQNETVGIELHKLPAP
jgi:hypothetical protein